MKNYTISAFFPVYNDAGTVELMVDRLREILPTLTHEYEIIIIDDCSPDDSGKIADQLAKKYKQVRVVHHEKNKGYGGALKSGFAHATKDLVFYTDGDAQYDVRELPRLFAFIDQYDVVNGYKIRRSDRFYRKLLGGPYNFGVRLLFGLKVRDVDCDFRLMHRKIFNTIELVSNSGMICVEMMKKIQDAGYSIKNVPVNHYSRIYGESQFFKVGRIARTLFRLAQLWVGLVLLKKHTKYHDK